MELKPGSRWRSAVCTAEVVVVRPPKAAVTLECGGQAMIALTAEKPEGLSPSPDHAAGTTVGKRYVDEEAGIEVLGSKAGQGSLSVDGRALALKEAKPLPSSD
jgi:hypothetical protein